MPLSLHALLSRPALALAGLASLAGVALSRLPLFEVPGYELSEAMAVLGALATAFAGVVAARRQRTRGGPPLHAPLAAGLLGLALLVPPFLAAVLGSALTTRCSPCVGVGFYALLPVPSVLFAATVGGLCGYAFRRGWAAGLALVALGLGSLAASLHPLWAGPQVFALNHALGYFPGPLYDEALPVEGRLVVYRLLTLAWTGVGLLALAGRAGAEGLLPRARLPWTGWAMLAALLAAIAGAWAYEFELGLRTTPEALARFLGGHGRTAHFDLVFPAEKPTADVRRLERELEFEHAQVARFLGGAPGGRITAWFHRSPEEKRRRVGASETSFAKPWRLEFHVHDEPFPHPITRHELAHAMAAPFGGWPFAVPARLGVLVHIGLVEGVAVAADERADELTLHEWAAAMRRLGLAPDARTIVGPAGFYQQSAARAYTLAGSLLRFLRERHGAEALQRVYRDGDFEAALGRPLDALARDWEAFLDALPLDERALHAAQVRFERPGIFSRPCPREIAALREDAESLRARDPEGALERYQRCAAIEPQNAAYLRAQAGLFAERGETARAGELWEKALALANTSAGRAAGQLGRGDAAWAAGDLGRAREAYAAALALHRDRATDRLATVKLLSVSDPEAAPVLRRFFTRAGVPEVLEVAELARRQPGNAWARYLVARQLLQHQDPAGTLRWLGEAMAAGLEDPELVREARRMEVQARFLTGDCHGASPALDRLEASDPSDRSFAQEWRARCDFEAAPH